MSLSYLEAKAAVEAHGGTRGAAKVLGVTRRTVQRALRRGLEVDAGKGEGEPIEALLNRREAAYARKAKAWDASAEITVRVPGSTDQPIGILHLGDPHLDDDGTDLPLLRRHVELVQQTEGLYAASVGDLTNNWVGHLSRLWAEQATTATEAWRLAEWLIGAMPWLYLVRGNHDHWSGTGDPLDWICRHHVPVDAAHDARIRLVWPSGQEARVWARHDFPGHSQWAKSHGQAKAAVLGGYPADIIISGHRHCWESRASERADGSVYHAIQVGSYKRLDAYSASLGHPSHKHGAACLTVLDPNATPTARVVVFWDVELGASFLHYLRSRAQ